ncbi:MAG TPA: pitrilysin family protein, partial [Bdellovibrionota bacterium]|nr:pitrilysin family protein [Bdellovibrionota bacterium]
MTALPNVRGASFSLWLIAAAVSIAAWTQPVQAQPAWVEKYRLPSPEIEKLPNGLELAWFVDSSPASLPLVDLAVLVRSGSRDDLPGKSGTAELLSNLLDKGAGGKDAQALAHAIEKLGATRYINADDDTFSIGLHGLAQDSDALLALLSDMALRPDLPQDEFGKEKRALLAKWDHIGDYAETLATLAFQRALLSNTSYARGGLWNAREASELTLKDVADFHRTHFTPANTILMVVGRLDRATFRKKILDAFGAWTGGAPKREHRSYRNDFALATHGQKLVLVDRPGLSQAQVRIGFEAPGMKDPDRYALAVGNTLLGE